MLENGQTVTVAYTGTLEDGSVFDTTEGIEPLTFTIGEGTVIAGFDEAVRSMKVGDKIVIDIPPEKAFGFYDEDKIVRQPMLSLPNPMDFEVGKSYVINREGLLVNTTLLGIDVEGNGLFDFNQPLAEHTLTFSIELLKVD